VLFVRILARREELRAGRFAAVAQVSQPAVSPISQSAGCGTTDGVQVWKPAIQQTWKSAPLWLRLCRYVFFCG